MCCLSKSLVYFLSLLFFVNGFADVDPLPSWNEGEIKTALIQFVKDVTDKNSSYYVAPEERIATFDQDGTLWVEQPIYTQFIFAIDRVKAIAENHPEWKKQEPFQTIMEGDLEKMKKFTDKDFIEIVAATHAGMSVEDFEKIVRDWLKNTVHPRFKKPFTDLVYQPMLEVIQFLAANDFQNYIVSGGGQEFMRAYAERVYRIPLQRIIGSAGFVNYEYRDGKPVLIKQPKILFIDDKKGKPEGINLFIGRRPIAAFGNSDGDRQMLEWTQAGKGKRFELLVHHDDAVREYAYGPESKVGTFSDALMEEAMQKKWHVVSMKRDWKVIFNP